MTRTSRPGGTAVYLEVGAKRVFASALDWPGWCRSGRDEDRALAALAAVAPRYAAVAAEAGTALPPGASDAFDVVERVRGSATTDFGAPDKPAQRDGEPLTLADAERLAALLAATWMAFDRIVAAASRELRKGPRGGGRDRDAIVAHVLGAEAIYARKLGIRARQPTAGDAAAIAVMRSAILQAIHDATAPATPVEKGWLPRYAARRIAWHVLDHAWEIEDRRIENRRIEDQVGATEAESGSAN